MTQRFYFVAHGGFVQGVGFRDFTQKRARQYGITGWCRNTPNNKVEGEAQGEKDALEQFFKDVDSGPRLAKVVQLTKETREVAQDETSFSVRS